MKLFTLSLFLLIAAAVTAQNTEKVDKAAPEGLSSLPRTKPVKKWSFNTFQGVSAGFMGWRSGYASTIATPMGVQLNRDLNKNLFAFGAVSVAPAYVSFNRSFMNTSFNKGGFNSGFAPNNNFGLYQRAELGLGYKNDAGTFQVSGSIGIQRSSNGFGLPYSQNTWMDNQQMMRAGNTFR